MAIRNLISLENEELVVQEQEPTQTSEQVDLEYSEASNEIMNDFSEVESVTNDVNALGALADKAEEIQERDGGLSEDTAEVLDLAVETIYARLGLKKKPTLAMESIVDQKTGKRVVTIAIEDWKQKVKDFWEMIKKAFWQMVHWVKSFFKSAEKKSEQQNQKLKELIETSKGKKKAATESIGLEKDSQKNKLPISTETYLSGIVRSGSNNFMSEINKTFKTLQTAFSASLAESQADAGIEKSLDELVRTSPETKEQAYALFDIKHFNRDCLSKYGGKIVSIEQGLGFFELELVKYTTSISYYFPSPEITDGKVFNAMLRMRATIRQHSPYSVDRPEPLNQEQMAELYKMFLDDTDAVTKKSLETEKELEDAMKFFDKQAQTTEKDAGNTVVGQVLVEVLKGTHKTVQVSQHLLAQLRSYNLKLRDAIFDYCVWSLKQEA